MRIILFLFLLINSTNIFGNQYIDRYKNELLPKYKNCFQTFINFKSYKLHYCYINNNSKELYIISPGRNESGLKYTEIAQDLINKKGVNILLIDHINQGFSTRVVEGTDKVHINDFNDYFLITDLLIKKILAENSNIEITNGFAHSMGAFILLEVAKLGHVKFQNLYLSSPMFGISTRGIPMPLAVFLARTLSSIGFAKNYAFFQGTYQKKPFSLTNLNTQNTDRYDFAQYIYEISPELKSAGSTFGWVNEVLKATANVTNDLNKLAQTNVIIFQAGNDKVVDNDVQTKVCQKLPQCRLIYKKDSYHDFIHEIDETRALIYQEMDL